MEESRRRQRKASKYCMISVILTIIMLFLSSCATTSLLLDGDNRTAYNRLNRAKYEFKYPSSVKIVYGTVISDILYCTVTAKNGLGMTGQGKYVIYSDGSIYRSTSYLCDGKGLNTELINSVLSGYANPYETVRVVNMPGFLNGGANMWIVYVIIGVLYFVFNGILAGNASDVAASKGEDKRKWFHMCFWLGPIAYIIIAAMPDQVLRDQMNEMMKLIKQNESSDTSSSASTVSTYRSTPVGASSYSPPPMDSTKKLCPKCGARNNVANKVCFACNAEFDS